MNETGGERTPKRTRDVFCKVALNPITNLFIGMVVFMCTTFGHMEDNVNW